MAESCKCTRSINLDLPAVEFGFVNWVRLSNKEAEKVSLKHLQGSLETETDWVNSAALFCGIAMLCLFCLF